MKLPFEQNLLQGEVTSLADNYLDSALVITHALDRALVETMGVCAIEKYIEAHPFGILMTSAEEASNAFFESLWGTAKRHASIRLTLPR